MRYWTDKEIEEYSKKNLLENDKDVYNVRDPYISFCIGRDDKRSYILTPLRNMTIVGDNNDITKYVRTLILQLNMRYAPWQMMINIWDGSKSIIGGSSVSIKHCELHGVCCNYTESTLPDFISHVCVWKDCALNRYILHNVVILHRIQNVIKNCEYSTRQSILERIKDLMTTDNATIIMTYDKTLDLSDYLRHYQYEVIYFIQHDLFTWIDAANRTTDLQPIFYSSKVLKEICDRKTLPKAVRFSDHKLECLRAMLGAGRINETEKEMCYTPKVDFVTDILNHLVSIKDLNDTVD